jgi:holliday junction DNA helicase RuvA
LIWAAHIYLRDKSSQIFMYAYLKGEINALTPTTCILEVQGVGYHIQIPLSTFTALENQKQATVHTYLHVREDAMLLYGFASPTERNMFVHLISVSGVGPNTAQIILSSMNVEEVHLAIISDQAHVLQRIKGIGAKTAKQMILDLKDKLMKAAPDAPLLAGASIPTHSAEREDALAALLAMGFARVPALKALNQAISEGPGSDVQTLIKKSLASLQR